MKFANVAELHNKTAELLRMVEKEEGVIITRRGKPIALLHGLCEEELEDYPLAYHPELRAEIEEAYQQSLEVKGKEIGEFLELL